MMHWGTFKYSVWDCFLPTSRGKANAWIWKHEGLPTIPSSEKLSLEALVWQYWLVHGWNNAQHCESNPNGCYESNNFISISCDEVTSVDNQSWLSLHAYIMKEWSQIPISLSCTWCDRSFGGGFPSILDDGRLWGVFQTTHQCD
jgi:hypothetical protein